MKNCAWCGKPIEETAGYTGSGPDLLCSSVCSGKYWAWEDETNDSLPSGIDLPDFEDEEDFF